tara:strand:- start:4788 stop:4937 length:150 start_codon:yes stop_codon:yes gene_type:complete
MKKNQEKKQEIKIEKVLKKTEPFLPTNLPKKPAKREPRNGKKRIEKNIE